MLPCGPEVHRNQFGSFPILTGRKAQAFRPGLGWSHRIVLAGSVGGVVNDFFKGCRLPGVSLIRGKRETP